jgi:macrolide transport system ATP-binding/permease protein
MADSFISLSGITRTFAMGDSEYPALRGVDLTVEHGEFVAIVGPSGSGKSTLMYILGCLDSPTGGTYTLDGRPVSGLDDSALSRIRNAEIGFVFQQYNLLADLDVVDNIALGLVYAGTARAERQQTACGYADQFGLGGHLGHRASELSGGQMQRVAIARALAGRPRLILADEPTGNLDSATGRDILAELKNLHSNGHTVVMVTHDRKVADQAERVVTIMDGRIVEDTGVATTDASPAAETRSRTPRPVRFADTTAMAVREGLLAKKTRTALTMLGIVFGIAAVIAMNGITEGGKRKQLDQIRQIGLNNIQLHDSGIEGARLLRERRRNPYGLSASDLAALREHLPDLAYATAWRALRAEVRKDARVVEDGRVLGVTGDFQEVVNFQVARGRFLMAHDEQNHHRVCVAGSEVIARLGIADDPLGAWLLIGDEPFRVVGVMGRKRFSRSDVRDVQIIDRNLDIYVPYSSLKTYFRKDAYAGEFEVISLRMADEHGLVETSLYAQRIVRELHNRAEDFVVSVPLEKLRQAQQTKEVFNIIIVVIAAISLVVGGIGIMNIMLATVTERRREIGIRRAVGASRRNIMSQFLTEAVLMSCIGGLLGLLVGALAGKAVEAAFAFPVAFNPVVVAAAIGVSVAVGVVFGSYPAWLAARLDPVTALRTG